MKIQSLLPVASLLLGLLVSSNCQAADPTPAPAAPRKGTTGIAKGKGIEELAAGNKRYLSGGVMTHSWLQERIEVTGDIGQSPSVGVLSCADSRIPVEMIFDQSVGDLFVVRVAGNYQSPDAAGTFEFGVEALGVHTLLVLGHTKCGAVNAALDGANPPGNMQVFIRAIRPALEAHTGGVSAIKSQTEAVEINVRWQLQQLLARSEILRKAKEEGRLQILLGVYDVTTGAVRFLK
ncbi:MAG: carbonic anhydrase [Verrucomicrobiota bacterium]